MQMQIFSPSILSGQTLRPQQAPGESAHRLLRLQADECTLCQGTGGELGEGNGRTLSLVKETGRPELGTFLVDLFFEQY